MYFSDDSHRAKEKQKARDLRKSRWWQTKLQNPECYYCTVKLTKEEATMDHIVPISRGGKSQKGNLVVCCKDCNSQKKYLTPVEWALYLDRARSASPSAES